MTQTSTFDPPPGIAQEVGPGIRRILAPNPSPMTFRGTNTYLLGDRQVAVIDPGPDDMAHLQAIHGHLFQDVYEWAGKIREVEIAKGEQQFQPRAYIETGMADVHRRLQQQHFLKDRTPEAFAEGAGQIIGDVNYVHPFREGNGRTQLVDLQQLGRQAGHEITLSRIEPEPWIEASIQSHRGNYQPMAACIRQAIGPEQERST